MQEYMNVISYVTYWNKNNFTPNDLRNDKWTRIICIKLMDLQAYLKEINKFKRKGWNNMSI